MTFGFRLFEVELVEHHRNSPALQSWDLPDHTPYADHAENALTLLCSAERWLESRPTWNYGRDQADVPPFTARTGDKVVRWISSTRVGPGHLQAAISYGVVGSHANALGPAGAPTDISKLAPSNLFRIELLLPPKVGPGLLVVETNGRGCPVEAVPRWLTVAGEILGGTPDAPGSSSHLVWKIRAAALLDREHLESMLNNSQKVQLGLQGTAPSASGISSGPHVRLEIDLDTAATRQSLVDKIFARLQGVPQSPNDLLAVVDLDDQLDDFDFRDGRIRIQDGTGEGKTIQIDRIKEIFTYPITKDLRPTDAEWTGHVQTKVETLRADLDW